MSALPQEASRPGPRGRRELARQLRVDSIRCTAARRLGPPHLQPVRRRPHGGAVRPPPALRLEPARPARQRPPDLLQGARLAAALRALQGGRRDRRPASWWRPTGRSARRCRDTPRRSCPGWTWPPARWARACPTASASRWPASGSTSSTTASGCCAATARLAEGSMWEALDKAVPLRAGQPDGDRRREPAGAVRTHRAGVGPGRLPAARRGVRLPRGGDRRPRPASRSTTPSPLAERSQLPDRHPGADGQGQGRTRGRGQERLARQAAAARRGRGGRHRGAGRRDRPQGRDAAAAVAAGGGRAERSATRHPAQVRDGHEGGDQGRLRRRARRARRPSRGGRHRRRGRQLHLHREVRRGLPRPLLPDVHLRAADGRRGGRA